MTRRLPPMLAAIALTTIVAPSAGATETADTTWRPASVPESPTYVVLESSPGDYIGQGLTYEYTPATAVIDVIGPSATGGRLVSVDVDGDERWSGRFEIPVGAPLDERLYDGATRYPFNPDDVPGLSWSGEGRGCNTLTGWFAVDGFAHAADGSLSFLALRFEQRCEGGTAFLRGEVRYDADAPPPAPLNPRPDPGDRWTPDRALLPADDSAVVLLDSQPGDFVGQGERWLYSGDAVTVGTRAAPSGADVSVSSGSDWWNGLFVAPDAATRLEVGLYDDLGRAPFHNPTLGGLSWSGNGRGCNTLEGWFVVDHVEYTGDALTGLSLRFEQLCGGSTAPLHGLVEIGVDRTPPDTTAPTVTLEGPPSRTKQRDATFVFTASEEASFTCSLDGATATPCSSPTTVTGLARGDHSFVVVATDLAGNSSAPAEWSWTIKGGGKGGRSR